MKRIGFLQLLIFSFLILNACAQKREKAESTTISVEAFQKLQQEKPDLVILDVRTPDEIAGGKIQGAIVLDYMKTDFESKVMELDQSNPIVVYCATGYRSGEAMALMKAKGFKEVYHLKGGVVAWQRKGLPLVR